MKQVNVHPNFPQMKGELKTQTGSLPVPNHPRINSGLLWHYTDARGLLGIVENNVLWATATTMLNDSRELMHGASKIEEVWESAFAPRTDIHADVKIAVKELLEYARGTIETTDTYVLCASLEDDSLSQWRGYGGADGYAISLDPTVMPRVYSQRNLGVDYGSLFNTIPGWREVQYEDDVSRQLCETFLMFVTDLIKANPEYESDVSAVRFSAAMFPYHQAISLLKSKGFADEREARFVVNESWFRPQDDVVHHRAGPLGLTPYIKLTSDIVVPGEDPALRLVRSFAHSNTLERLPIRSITIGPCQYPEAAKSGLRSLLRSTQYDDVNIELSQVSYR